jgi:hypothetical protein
LHKNSSSSIVACMFISLGTCLSSRCLVMNVYSGYSGFQALCHNITVFCDVTSYSPAKVSIRLYSVTTPCVALRYAIFSTLRLLQL